MQNWSWKCLPVLPAEGGSVEMELWGSLARHRSWRWALGLVRDPEPKPKVGSDWWKHGFYTWAHTCALVPTPRQVSEACSQILSWWIWSGAGNFLVLPRQLLSSNFLERSHFSNNEITCVPRKSNHGGQVENTARGNIRGKTGSLSGLRKGNE